MEEEVICTSDYLTFTIWMNYFINLQGYNVKKIIWINTTRVL